MKKEKKGQAESSIPLRVVCCLLSIVSITSSLVFGESPVPVVEFSYLQGATIFLCSWLCIGGGVVSYYYRETSPPIITTLIKAGAALIVLELVRELFEDNLVAQEFQLVRPLLHALVATSVLTSFELRTRGEINASAVFGFGLLTLAAISGKGLLFGACVFIYLCLGTMFLFLSCRSESLANTPKDQPLVRQTVKKAAPLSILFSVALLPLCSVAAFSLLPRMDSEADSISAKLRSGMASTIYKAKREQNALNSASDLTPSSRDTKVPSTAHVPTEGIKKRKPKKSEDATPPKGSDEKPTDADPRIAERDQHSKKAEGTSISANSKASGKSSPSQTSRNAHGSEGQQKTSAGQKTTAGQQTPAGQQTISPQQQTAEKQARSEKNPLHKIPAGRKTKKTHKTQRSQKADSNSSNATNSAEGKADPGSVPPLDQPSNGRTAETAANNRDNSPETTRAGKGSKKLDPSQKIVGKDLGKSAVENQRRKLDSKQAIVPAFALAIDRSMSDPDERLFWLACNRVTYVHLNAFDFFDGHNWLRTDLKESWDYPATFKGVKFLGCPSLEISDAVPVTELAQTYKLEADLGTPFIPVAGIPSEVSLIGGPIKVDAYGALLAEDTLKKGTTYSAMAQLPLFSLDDMRKCDTIADPQPAYLDRYVQLPDNLSNRTLDIAKEFAGSGNRFVQAERAVKYLRTNYKYDPLNAVKASGPKDENLVDTFLYTTKTGDCKSFSSAFVMLCRSIGIPSRLVVGFSPGEFDPVSGGTEVRRKHGHAWAEIYMPPYGWIPFDPSPGGLLPARPEQNYYNFARVEKDFESNNLKLHEQILGVTALALKFSGRLFTTIALVLSAIAAVLIFRTLRLVLPRLVDRLRPQHPAAKMRDRMIKRLSKHISIGRLPSDTSSELLTRIRVAHAETRPSRDEREKLNAALGHFFKTYDAVYFGQEDKLAELNGYTRAIETIFKK